jgi:hypothetical protein
LLQPRCRERKWLSGSKNVTSIVRVGTIKSEDGGLKIDGTVFAIAQGFSGFQSRDYTNPQMPIRDPDIDLVNEDNLFD